MKEIKLETTTLNQENIDRTLAVLINNGIDAEECKVVLQAIGYTLLDTELEELIWPNKEG